MRHELNYCKRSTFSKIADCRKTGNKSVVRITCLFSRWKTHQIESVWCGLGRYQGKAQIDRETSWHHPIEIERLFSKQQRKFVGWEDCFLRTYFLLDATFRTMPHKIKFTVLRDILYFNNFYFKLFKQFLYTKHSDVKTLEQNNIFFFNSSLKWK